MTALARHLLAEFYGCDPGILDDLPAIEELLKGAAVAARTTLLKVGLHKFAPQGVSGVAFLAESHLAIHTWPEHGFASIEIYVCGSDADPEAGARFLEERLQPSHVEVKVLPRGEMAKVRAHPPGVRSTDD